ncbi:MAG TPA: hypothetical protein VNB49_00935 [Candidatus Dormibacteraeota bacterium]|nr:hypothetical protein [Candidatus Dormibacteraeota bacterium]
MLSRQTPYVSLGILYYEEGRIAEACEVLQRCAEMFPNGMLNIEKISETLDAASKSEKPVQPVQKAGPLSAAARQEFYRLSLAIADRER